MSAGNTTSAAGDMPLTVTVGLRKSGPSSSGRHSVKLLISSRLHLGNCSHRPEEAAEAAFTSSRNVHMARLAEYQHHDSAQCMTHQLAVQIERGNVVAIDLSDKDGQVNMPIDDR